MKILIVVDSSTFRSIKVASVPGESSTCTVVIPKHG